VSEIYGSGGGYDRGDSHGNDVGDTHDSWDNYDPDAELEAMGITRTSEWERVRAQERGDAGYGDDQADDGYDIDPDAANYAAGNDPETAWRNQGRRDGPTGLGYPDGTGQHDESPDRPSAVEQPPGSPDSQRYPNGVTAADTDPRYYDGDIRAALAADTTPTRQQAARDDGPGREGQGGHDSASRPHDDPVEGHADIEATLHENDHLPEPRTRQEAVADAWNRPGQTPGETLTQDRNADQRNGPSELTSQGDAGAGMPGQTAETQDALRQRVADLESANTELRAENTRLDKGMGDLATENSELGKAMADLRSENADLRADNVELHRDVSALEVRLDRVEHDKPEKPAASIGAMEVGDQQVAKSEDKQPSGRREWTSNEALAFGAMAGGGIVTTVADFWSCLPATYAGITASVLGVGAAGIALVRKHREARNAHRPEH
jgi:hypothetical protein